MDSDAIGQDWRVAATSCAVPVSVHYTAETRLACKFLCAKKEKQSSLLLAIMEGLIVLPVLPPELRELDAQALLQATDLPELDCLDELLSQIPNPDNIQVEPHKPLELQDGEVCSETSSASAVITRFANPVGEEEVKAIQGAAAPANTQKSTTWAVKVWKDWSANRRLVSPSDWPPHLFLCSGWELNRWLCRFVLEVRRQDGKNYPPNTLYQICCGILRYVSEVKPELDIFKDQGFSEFRWTIDLEMKRLCSLGLGTTVKQAEPITNEEEDCLWTQRKLGPDTAQSLLDTMVFMCGLYFALRSGQEHRNLSVDQIKLVEPEDGVPHLVYTENVSKNNPGGLHNRKLKPKVVIHHANVNNPSRCFVTFYKAYMSHRPKKIQHNAFYLTPIRNPKSEVWYSTCPVGYRTLANTVNRLCKSVSIGGYKTNHSLRVTAATRLFQQGIDEQLIMIRTGHRSTDGVRAYKRVSETQQQALSNVLNRMCDRDATSEPPQKKQKIADGQENAVSTDSTPPGESTGENIQQAINVAAPNLGHGGGMHFSGCNNIIVNYYADRK